MCYNACFEFIENLVNYATKTCRICSKLRDQDTQKFGAMKGAIAVDGHYI